MGSAAAKWEEDSSKVCVREAEGGTGAYLSVNCAMESWSRDNSMLVTRESRVTLRGDKERSCESRWAGRAGRSAMSLSTGVALSRKDACACGGAGGRAGASTASRVEVEMGGLSALLPAPVPESDLDKAGTPGMMGDGAASGGESGVEEEGEMGGVRGLTLDRLVLVLVLDLDLVLALSLSFGLEADGEEAREGEVSMVN